LLGGGFALYSYRQGQQQRRAEWLDGLYTRFYEQAQYKRIRRILDYEVEPDLTILRNAAKDGTAADSIEELVDYLNFFEFLGSLNEMKQLSAKETSMMFDYYIKRMNDYPFVVSFVETQGFERLSDMMRTRRTAGPSWSR
jgi:hypothetical protein